MIYEIKTKKAVSPLFEGWEETMIWSCLQGTMGRIYADSPDIPRSAMAILGDFCFFAGRPERELVLYKPETCRQDFMIMVPQDEQWAELIEGCYKEKARKTIRYAFKKEGDVFDRETLRKAADTLPEGYTLRLMDEEMFTECKKTEWCRDFVSQYPDYSLYQKYGLGVLVLKDDKEIVAGASSYSGYLGGIEIEIDTRKEYRRRGFAYSCGARLILECLKRGWYPSWDAQNPWSVKLAEKLGYHFDHEYPAYEIWGY